MNHPAFTVTFLGTGTSGGVPMIACECSVCTSGNKKDNRLRSSIIIESATTTVVIDATPDFRYQMLRQKVKKIDAIVFTHPHKDHIAGLDDVRAFNFFSKQPVKIYLNSITEKRLRREYDYAFEENKYDGVPDIVTVPINEDPFTIGDLHFIPVSVMHYKMPVLGFRIGAFTYITDANHIEPGEQEKIKGSDSLVLNALRKEPHLSHFTLQQACALALQLEIPQTWLTHISHQMGLHDAVETEMPAAVRLAYDGLQLHFPLGK
jgi:phosphoribosyl 1,2-cyclic phosphate phosphodiesterase